MHGLYLPLMNYNNNASKKKKRLEFNNSVIYVFIRIFCRKKGTITKYIIMFNLYMSFYTYHQLTLLQIVQKLIMFY